MDPSTGQARGGWMGDTTITVRGSHSVWIPAERATVHVSVSSQGAARQDVFDQATASADAVRESIESLVNEEVGPITWWSSDSVSVWSERPWNNEGKQLAPVFHATVGFTAKFSEFEALARWIEQIAAVPGVTISHTDWALTEAHQLDVLAEVRSLAVDDAVNKATTYAKSIGLTKVRAIALADPGLLGDQSGGSAPMGFDLMQAKSGGGAVSLKPEEIEVSVTVEARFVAS